MCDCKLCQRGDKIDEFFKKYSFELEDRKWLNEMFILLCNVEEDLDYQNCVLHGDWPSSVEQLERALEQAREKRKIALDKDGGK